MNNKITAFLPNPDKKGFVDVYVDSEFCMTVSEQTLFEAKLCIGESITKERLAEIDYKAALSKAKAKAYDYLSYGDLSKKSLFLKLTRYGFDEDIANEAVEALESEGYIDDERYAERLARYYADTKLYGRIRICHEMCAKGVSKEMAESAVDALDTDFDENIQKLVNTKFRYAGSDPKQIKKVTAALMRYGYDYDSIRSVLCGLEDDYE